MRKKLEWKWEELDKSTKRSKVIGGWIVTLENSKHTAVTSVFIADRDHEWHIVQPVQEAAPVQKSSIAEDFATA